MITPEVHAIIEKRILAEVKFYDRLRVRLERLYTNCVPVWEDEKITNKAKKLAWRYFRLWRL